MVKMAFIAPFVAVLLFTNFIAPAIQSQGVDPFIKFRAQTDKIERKIIAWARWEPDWTFWN
jgi:hypothetical protein